MNYGESSNQNRTFLDQLPDIGEIQRKHIRNDFQPQLESGMATGMGNYAMVNTNEPMGPQQPMQEPIVFKQPELSCMTVAEHVKTCPICTYYYNTNTTPYMIIIVTLIIVILFLLKNILHLK